MRDPMIAENIKKFDWKFLFYDDVNGLSNKKRIEIHDIEKLFKIPKENKKAVQNSLNEYVNNNHE